MPVYELPSKSDNNPQTANGCLPYHHIFFFCNLIPGAKMRSCSEKRRHTLIKRTVDLIEETCNGKKVQRLSRGRGSNTWPTHVHTRWRKNGYCFDFVECCVITGTRRGCYFSGPKIVHLVKIDIQVFFSFYALDIKRMH